MTAITVNTLTGAVSEYTRHDFQSITPNHGGSASGLYAFGGDTDAGLPIQSTLRLPITLRENTLKQQIAMVYLSMQGQAKPSSRSSARARRDGRIRFHCATVARRAARWARASGKNYLGFGLSTPAGQAFTLDRVEVLSVKSKTRRV